MLIAKLNLIKNLKQCLNEKLGPLAIIIYLPIVWLSIRFNWLDIFIFIITVIGSCEIIKNIAEKKWSSLAIVTYFLGLVSLTYLSASEQILLVAVVFAGDVGAFICEKYLVPETKKAFLCSEISPDKTFQGFLAGFLCSFSAGSITIFTCQLSLSFFYLLPIIYASAVLGDLLGDELKRVSGIKNSRDYFWTKNWIIGYGGVYDLSKSLSMASLIFYIIMKF